MLRHHGEQAGTPEKGARLLPLASAAVPTFLPAQCGDTRLLAFGPSHF